MGYFESRYRGGEYLEYTGDWHEEDAAWKADHVLSTIAAAGLTARKIADVGCGTGGVLARLQARLPAGTDLDGFEMAEPAFECARRRGNAALRFHNRPTEPGRDGGFDLALALDVFEHVPDYLGFLSTLKPIARAFIFHIPLDLSARTVLDGTLMHKRRTVGHLHYFTADTARATLEDAGYRIRSSRFTHAIMQPPPVGWKRQLRRKPDEWLFRLNPRLCSATLGGCSLIVLAEPTDKA
jgi:SAM-dependent methyltransferase